MKIPDTNLLSELPLEVRPDMPLYAQLADGLKGVVLQHFGNGDLFFSEKTLVEVLPVSQITIRRALRELTNEGLLLPSRGRGTVVRLAPSAPKAIAVSQAPTVAKSLPIPGPRTGVRSIGFFRPEPVVIESEHTLAVMQEFQRQCDTRGMRIEFFDTADARRLTKVFREISGSNEEEAFILHTPSDTTLLLYHALENRGYHTVAMEGVAPHYPGKVVATDAEEAIRIGMDYLTSLGHRRIVLLVNEPASEYNVQDKIVSFRQYLVSAGLEHDSRVVLCDNVLGRDSYEAAYEHMPEAMGTLADRPTAIFTVSDPGAWASLKWCGQNGISVPDEISVLGFENARSSKYMNPGLSSVAHPVQQIVEKALDTIWDDDSPSVRYLIKPTLVIRESTTTAPAQTTASNNKASSGSLTHAR